MNNIKLPAWVFLSIFIMVLVMPAGAQKRRDPAAPARELEVLKNFLQEARDSLQHDISDRWRQKQRHVEQREVDKEEIARARERLERLYGELARIKEEAFARERQIEDEQREIVSRREAWDFLAGSFEEVFDREVKAVAEAHPLSMERRRQRLETIRRVYRQKSTPSMVLDQTVGYYLEGIKGGSTIWSAGQVVIPDGEEPREMKVFSLGNVLGYALSTSGEPYIIRQTGRLGADRYAIERIDNDRLTLFVQEKLPSWNEAEVVDGGVIIDVMQNQNAGILIAGKRIDPGTRIIQWLKVGGPIMVPLVILMLWALALVCMKMLQYARKDKSNRALYETVAKMLKSGQMEQAHNYAKSHKGVVAKVVTTCLEHSKWNRSSAEKAVREILIDETPQLNKHLATLAVIAGSAPLLGLLGTVTGMINLFEVITHYGTGDPKILAGGISEALVTTQAGLSVAIPILLIHNALRNRSLRILSDMEKHAIRILNRLWPET